MRDLLHATPEMAIEYARWFVNRRAYTLQSDTPHPASGRHYYFRPRKRGNPLELTSRDIQRHLAGEITIGLYAINPAHAAGEVDGDRRRLQEGARGSAEAPI